MSNPRKHKNWCGEHNPLDIYPCACGAVKGSGLSGDEVDGILSAKSLAKKLGIKETKIIIAKRNP